MFSRILAALLVVAISSPVGVLAQVDTTNFGDFAEAITAVESLVQYASGSIPKTSGIPAGINCVALTAASTLSLTTILVSRMKDMCPAAFLACQVANAACTAAHCSGCSACPSC